MDVPSEDVQFVADCAVETDMELYIPDDYVSQTTEKIKLYKELDAMKEDDGIDAFMASLEDRFGPPPEEVKQLSFVVRIRHLAVKMGFEKIVLRQGVMLMYFISDASSAYYKTEQYQRIMSLVASRRIGKVNYKQEQNKLWIKVPGVDSISKAYDILRSLK